jgi:multidrug efflux pump subunit AcrA (membrane-fusion protein)
MTTRRLVGAGVVLAVATVAGGLLADSPSHPTATMTRPAPGATVIPTTQASPGTLHTVSKGVLTMAVDGDGQFEAVEPFEVRVRPKAYAADLTVQAAAESGAEVKKGDVLLQLDPANLKRDLQQAENDLTLARANLKKAQEDVRLGAEADRVAMTAASNELANARTNLKWLDEVDGPNTVKMAELLVKEYKDQAEDQGDELDQLKKMYKTDDLTTATGDIVIKRAVRQLARINEQMPIREAAARKAKEVQTPQTRQAAEVAVERARVGAEQLKVAQEQARVAREAALASAQIAAGRAEQKLADLRGDLEQLTVRAPADGVVLYGGSVAGAWQNNNPRALRAGERVAPQQVLITLIEPGKVRAVVAAPENKLSAVRVGAKASVVPKALPGLKYEGRVTGVARLPGQRAGVAGYDVQIELGEVDRRVLPAMTAAVKVEPERVEGVVLVPAGAVAGGKVTVRGADGKDAEREVTAGRTDGKFVEIVGGLNEGERVVTK